MYTIQHLNLKKIIRLFLLILHFVMSSVTLRKGERHENNKNDYNHFKSYVK